MSTNPLMKERTQRAVISKHAHKLLVHGVYDWRKSVKEEVFDAMRIYCVDSHIAFRIRPFAPTVVEEDRIEIERLPAFQIYYENKFEKTCYPESCIEVLKQVVLAIDAERPQYLWHFRFPTLSFSLKRRSPLAASVAPERN